MLCKSVDSCYQIRFKLSHHNASFSCFLLQVHHLIYNSHDLKSISFHIMWHKHFPNAKPTSAALKSAALSICAHVTCRNTQSPPPTLAVLQSAAPAGLVSRSFPVVSSRSHRAQVAQASLTWQRWRVKGRVQSCRKQQTSHTEL